MSPFVPQTEADQMLISLTSGRVVSASIRDVEAADVPDEEAYESELPKVSSQTPLPWPPRLLRKVKPVDSCSTAE